MLLATLLIPYGLCKNAGAHARTTDLELGIGLLLWNLWDSVYYLFDTFSSA